MNLFQKASFASALSLAALGTTLATPAYADDASVFPPTFGIYSPSGGPLYVGTPINFKGYCDVTNNSMRYTARVRSYIVYGDASPQGDYTLVWNSDGDKYLAPGQSIRIYIDQMHTFTSAGSYYAGFNVEANMQVPTTLKNGSVVLINEPPKINQKTIDFDVVDSSSPS